LSSNKIVKILGQSRSRLFCVDFQNPLANGLKVLFDCERARWDELISALREILQTNEHIEAAWYYGSVARAEDTLASDFDIAVVAPQGQVDTAVESVRQALQIIEDRLYLNCSVVGLSGSDVVRLSEGDKWWFNLVRDAKVLKGADPEQYLSNSKRSKVTP
jgi:predicted nucleotidyltransferase